MKKNSIKIRVLCVMVILVLSMLVYMPHTAKGLTSHAPIRINSDAEFTPANGVTSGSGTVSDPYIIENLDINGSDYGYALHIGNTTAYFIVRNNYLYSASGVGSDPYYPDSGLILYNVTNGKIENNTVSGNSWYGIYLYSSCNNNITNNNVTGNSRKGIYLYSSSNNNNLTNNNASRNPGSGIWLSSSHNNTITNNNATGNSGHGICLSSSHNNTIMNNSATDNNKHTGTAEYGICLFSSHNNNITNNNVTGNSWHGIHLHASHNNNFMSNNASGNIGYGIYLSSSHNNNITNNNVTGNSWGGINLTSSNNNNITNNNVTGNSWRYGICLDSSNNNNITNNNATRNSGHGIHLYYSDNNNITDNNASRNDYTGIYLFFSSNNNIINNNASSNFGHGIYFDSSNDNNIISNNATGNSYNGIYFASSNNNNIINNNATGNSYSGICLYYSSNSNTIINNNASGNSQDGLWLVLSNDNRIVNSSIQNNKNHGIYIENSSNNILRNNILENNTYNFGVEATSIYDFYQDDINTSNTINGKPIYYIIGQSNLVFDEKTEVGYLGLVSCSNISVKNLTLSDNSQGLLLVSTSYSTITLNRIYNNYYGIHLFHSSNDEIGKNHIYNNFAGIYISPDSSKNELHFNNIYNNTAYGIYNKDSNVWADAIYNWWGNASGPGGVGPGTGDNVSTNVNYDPWLIEPLDLTPPTIIQTSPYNSEIDVPVDTKIVITFSEVMSTTTIYGNITIEPGVEVQDYVWSNGNTNLTLILSSNLSSYTKYTITINTNITDSGITDSSGATHYLAENYLQEAYIFSFRTVDITQPIITIISPSNGTITNQNVTLIYEISDNADLLENLTITGPESGEVYSAEGNYTITITVTDRANNTAKKTISFAIDKTAPTVNITGVVNGYYYDASVTPMVEIADANLNTTSIKLNNADFISGTTITGEGNYTLTIQAVDKANNFAELRITFVIDRTLPDIKVANIIEDKHYNTSVTPEINITDVNLDVKTISTELNGETFVRGTTISEEGKYVLVVKAKDKAGNENMLSINFTIDKHPPSLKIEKLPELTNKVELKIKGETDGIEVLVNDEKVNVTNGNFFITLQLKEGENNITIAAKDLAGNVGIIKKKIVLDTKPPSIKIIAPKENKTLKKEIVVKGETEPGAKVYINDIEVHVNEKGEFSHKIKLAKGNNTIIIKAVDGAGNENKEVLVITKITEKPKVWALSQSDILFILLIILLGIISCVVYVLRKK